MSTHLTATSITGNSNKPFYTESAFQDFATEIQDLIQNGLILNEKESDEVFGSYPSIEQVKVTSFNVELGQKLHRGHFHMVIEIRHRIQKYSVTRLNKRLKNWLNEHYGRDRGIKSWAVYIKLTPRYQENYANKEARAKIEEPDKEESQRLSDERDLKEITTKFGKMTVLQGNEFKGPHRSYNKS